MTVTVSTTVVTAIARAIRPSVYVVLEVNGRIFCRTVPVMVVQLAVLVRYGNAVFFTVQLMRLTVFQSVIHNEIRFPTNIINRRVSGRLGTINIRYVPRFLRLIRHSRVLIYHGVITGVMTIRAHPPIRATVTLMISGLHVAILVQDKSPGYHSTRAFWVECLLSSTYPITALMRLRVLPNSVVRHYVGSYKGIIKYISVVRAIHSSLMSSVLKHG